MINKFIAYNIAELEKYKIQTAAKNLYKNKLLQEEQWHKIQIDYASNLYTPGIFLKILLFLVSLFGMSTVMGPIGMIFSVIGMIGYRIISVIVGILLIILTEKVLIQDKLHYKSGVTEAGIYTGLSFITFGIIGFDFYNPYVISIIGLILALFAAIRYLNIIALVASFLFLGWILFQTLSDIGGMAKALIPFAFMIFSGLGFYLILKLQKKFPNVIFETQFIVAKIITLCIFYTAGNYYVVRELSVQLMDLKFVENSDIPFAFIFYILTAIVPIAYIYWGIKQKSVLFIRVGLAIAALSVLTFKYYFSLGHPEITITVAGAVLISIALLLFKYLKQNRNGFTREKLLSHKWDSPELFAFIASQTLGGNQINNSGNNENTLNGGEFGGGGAGGNY